MKFQLFFILVIPLLFLACNEDSLYTKTTFQVNGKTANILAPPGIDVKISPLASIEDITLINSGNAEIPIELFEEILDSNDQILPYSIQTSFTFEGLKQEHLIPLEEGIQGYQLELPSIALSANTLAFYTDDYGNYAWLPPEEVSSENDDSKKTILKIPIINDDSDEEEAPMPPTGGYIHLIQFGKKKKIDKKFLIVLNRYRLRQVVFDLQGNWSYSKKDPKPGSIKVDSAALLLIHGTNAGPEIAFGQMLTEYHKKLEAKYGKRIFAFIHPSIRKSVKKNSKKLKKELTPWGFKDLDIAARSRGSLVARHFLEQRDPTSKVATVKRLVTLAALNRGTPSSKDFSSQIRTLSVNAKLKKLPKTKDYNLKNIGRDLAIASMIIKDASGVEGITDATGSLTPGAKDMNPESVLLKELNEKGFEKKPSKTKYYGIGAQTDFQAIEWNNQKLQERSKDVDTLLQETFENKDIANDGIVPTMGSFGLIEETKSTNIDQSLMFDCNYLLKNPKAHHINYMFIKEAKETMIYFLTEENPTCDQAKLKPLYYKK